MAELRRFGSLDLILLLVVLAAAAGTRVAYLVICADNARSPGFLRVQERAPSGPGAPADETERLIAAVREGAFRGYAPFASEEELTAHVAPGYPYLAGVLARVVPEERLYSTIRWIQAGLGALTAALYFLFARRAFRSLAVGTVAGLLAGLNPFWIISTATIDDATLASFALAGCLLLAGQAGEQGGDLRSLALGLALAGLALVRASFLPFSFAAMIWFLIRSRSLEAGWRCALVAFLGFLIGLAPWTVRNVRSMGSPLPIVSTAYLHLWIGNNPTATGGPATEETWKNPPTPTNELAAIDDQAKRYDRLGPRVKKEGIERPVSTVKRRVHAFLAFFLGDHWLTQEGKLAEENESEEATMPEQLRTGYPMLLQTWLGAMLLLALVGWRWSYAWRWESFPLALAAFWVPLPYVIGHAEALSGPRLPLDGVLLCFAAVALVGLLLPTSRSLLNPDSAGPPAEPPAA